MVYRRTFLRLLDAAAIRLGYPIPSAEILKALYGTLSPAFVFDPLRLPRDHANLLAEFAGAGFTLGATFQNSSDSSPVLFAALMRGMPPELGLSEVREDLLGRLLQPPVASDFKIERRELISHRFCTRVLESARAVHHSWQYLRIFGARSPALGTPPAELSEFPLVLHHVLDGVMPPNGPRREHCPMDRPEALRLRASKTLDHTLEPWELTALSMTMNSHYARLLVEANSKYALADCRTEHFNDWFD